MELFKKSKSKTTEPIVERNKKIDEWEKKLTTAKSHYEGIVADIDDNFEAYKGTRPIYNSKGVKAKDVSSSRKVTFELVETQVDTMIPQPKVTSVNGNYDRAQIIEHYLKNELDRLPFEEINDEQARMTAIAGASIFLVEWNNSLRTRNTIGKLVVKNIDPREIIPQPGVTKLQDMDYIFMELLQTKQEIQQRYGVDVSTEENTNSNDETYNDELVTHRFVYYKNEDGYISLFSWVGNIVVQDIDNYFARKVKVCTSCGTPKGESDKCEVCGKTKFTLKTLTEEKLIIPSQTIDPNTNQPVVTQQEITINYYVPKRYPFVIYKNASDIDSLLGTSDVQVIKDQQNDLNIFNDKIKEKLLKGGSLITLPEDLKFTANNEELKIVRVKTPAQLGMIKAEPLQPSINNDIIILDRTYEYARQTIGVTDSYQGRKDSSALSGKAKEFAAQQTAGRFESKRTMKNFAYSQLFEIMFQFILAYADEPRSYHFEGQDGKLLYKMFDKRSFINQSDNGDYYYDDEFIFACDDSAALSTNRKAMWEETRLNFTSGAYGNPQDLQTIQMFWQMMDSLHYPGSKEALSFAAQRVQQQQEMAKQQQEITNQQNTDKLAIDALGKMNKNQGQQAQQTAK